MKNTHEIVKNCIALGFKPVPMKYKDKAPAVTGWPELEIDLSNMDQYFPKNQDLNIAIIMGEKSGNIIDVDIDDSLALHFADLFLPKTEFIYGRKGNPDSHRWYRVVSGELASYKRTTKNHGCFIEYRGNNLLSTYPGSTHPSGEEYIFSCDGQIAEIDAPSLKKYIDLVAACSLACKEWPLKGSRQDAALSFASVLCKAGYDDDEVIKAVYEVSKRAMDDEPSCRKAAAEATIKKYKAGNPITGFKALSENFGDENAQYLSSWLNIDIKCNIDDVMEEFNERYACVQIGGKAKILDENHNPYGQNDGVIFHDIAGFKQYYQNHKIETSQGKKGSKYKSKAEIWLEHKNRRSYEGVVFIPDESKCNSSYFNTWKGFGVKPCPTSSCALFLDHLKTVVCSNNEHLYLWLLAWMADAIQNPCEKPGTAIILTGKRGTGKSFVGTYFGSLFDPHRSIVSQASHVVGKFNSHLADVAFLQCEEAFWAGDKNGEGVLKDLITNDYINIERKGIDVVKQRNFLRIMVTSNESWVVPAGNKERRFLVLNVSDTHMQDEAYFNALASEMNNHGKDALLYYLQNYKYSDINLRKPPYTKALENQMLEGLHPVGKFLYIALNRGSIYPKGTKWNEYVPTDDFRDICVDTIKDIGLRHKSMQTYLGIGLKEYFGEFYSKKKINTMPYDKTTGDLQGASGLYLKSQEMVYVMPSLEKARELFTQTTGIEFEPGTNDYSSDPNDPEPNNFIDNL